MKIRKARLADVPDTVKLWKEMLGYHKRFKGVQPFVRMRPDKLGIMGKYIRRSIRSRYSLVLVAEERGKPVGYMIAHIKKNIPLYTDNKLGVINDLYVRKSHRGKGISSAFKKEAFSWFRKNKIKQAEIGIWWGNENTRKIYKKWGFRGFTLVMRKCLQS